MNIDFFGLFSVDALYILLGLLGLTLITLIIAIVAVCKAASLKRKYRLFMEGTDGKSIESLIKSSIDDIEFAKKISTENNRAIKDIKDKMQYAYQKVGIIKYDAFHEMGGKLSFALCMLDKKNNGYVVNVMHSNTGCFSYIKEIIDGKSYIELGDEEQQAVDQALAGKMGDPDLGSKINNMIDNK